MAKSEKVYTLQEIRELYIEWENTPLLRVLKQGKWTYQPVQKGKPIGNIDGIKAQVVSIKSVMSFPKFIKAKEERSGI